MGIVEYGATAAGLAGLVAGLYYALNHFQRRAQFNPVDRWDPAQADPPIKEALRSQERSFYGSAGLGLLGLILLTAGFRQQGLLDGLSIY